MWLADDEIQAHLDAGTQERFFTAIEALRGRYELGDSVRVHPLTADLLKVCTDEIPSKLVDHYLDFVIGVDGVPSLPIPDNWYEVTKALCLYFGTTGVFDVAQRIQIANDGEALVAIVMAALEKQVAAMPDDRLFFAGYFLDCLIDGEQPIWDATMTALDQWSVNPKTRQVVSEIRERLDEERKSRWFSNS